MHLETRFAQLSTAIEMELWQEAYRTVEDVHSLIVQMKRPPKAATMAGYHAQLAQVERGRDLTLTLNPNPNTHPNPNPDPNPNPMTRWRGSGP